MTKNAYAKMLQAMRINKDFFCYETMIYWANGNKSVAQKIYAAHWQEPDCLTLKALRIRSGAKLKIVNGKLRLTLGGN